MKGNLRPGMTNCNIAEGAFNPMHQTGLLTLQKDILATLTYFNMFDYPLKKRELYIFLACKVNMQEFEVALKDLLDAAAIFKIGNFYSLFNNRALADRRVKGNQKAALLLKKAEQVAALIASFPFVKGVAVSGSLSKRFAGEDADIDFFIITAANRLWIARTFLHFFKKITFILNMQDFFCMNYFVDESHPCILEKNVYTATEIATIIPMRGMEVFDNFYTANRWTKDFLPNNNLYINSAKKTCRTWCTRLTEKLLDNRAGNYLDNLLMKLTARSWNAKARHKKRNSKGLLLGMHTGKHFSKPDPGNFQQKLLQRYQGCLQEVVGQYDLSARVKNKFL